MCGHSASKIADSSCRLNEKADLQVEIQSKIEAIHAALLPE